MPWTMWEIDVLEYTLRKESQQENLESMTYLQIERFTKLSRRGKKRLILHHILRIEVDQQEVTMKTYC